MLPGSSYNPAPNDVVQVSTATSLGAKPYLQAAAALWNQYLPAGAAQVRVVGQFENLAEPIIGKAYCTTECKGPNARWCCDDVVRMTVSPSIGHLAADVFVHELGHALLMPGAKTAERTLIGGHWQPAEHGEVMGAVMHFPVWLAQYTVLAANGTACGPETCNGTCTTDDAYARVPPLCTAASTTDIPWHTVATVAAALSGVVAAGG